MDIDQAIKEYVNDTLIARYEKKTLKQICPHNHIGTRYLYMKMSFDMIEPYYTKDLCYYYNMLNINIPIDKTDLIEYDENNISFLRYHLIYWILHLLELKLVPYCKEKYEHCHVLKYPTKKEEGRRDLPTSIYKFLRTNNTPWRSKKVTLSWIVCYIFNIDPDCNKPGWEKFQCSHRCIGAGENLICLNYKHLVWELSANNQSRGSTSEGRRICCITCQCFRSIVEKHTLCIHYKIHDPPCCEPLIEID